MRAAEPDLRDDSGFGRAELPCPICRSPGPHNRYPAKEMVNGTREVFDYFLCAGCGTLFLGAPPRDMGPYYGDYYSTKTVAPPVAPRSLVTRGRRWARTALCGVALRHPSRLSTWLFDRLTPLPPYHGLGSLCRVGLSGDDRILDVGCGPGDVVEALGRMGFRCVLGCDPFIAADVTFPSGARVVKGGVDAVPGTWDLIMMHHSFEHVLEPRATIRTLEGMLSPRGRILLRFPNVGSVEFTRYGRDWWGIHAPRHVTLPSRRGLELILEGTSLRIADVWCDSQPDHYLYSHEYQLDIPDNDPRSVRAGNRANWTDGELDRISARVDGYNSALVGDWIAYLLERS